MNKCNVIRDLLPLYADKVCSEDSKEMVEEHLAECKECKQELEDYCYKTGIEEVSTDVVMKNFKKKMGKKNFKKVCHYFCHCFCRCFLAWRSFSSIPLFESAGTRSRCMAE